LFWGRRRGGVASTLGVGLVAHYLMNDSASDTIVLDTTTNYNGTATQNTSDMTAAGRINSALGFTGSGSSEIDVGDLSSEITDAMSISLWFNVNDIDNFQSIFSVQGDPGSECSLKHLTLAPNYNPQIGGFGEPCGGDGITIDNMNISTQTWYHFVLLEDSSGGEIYLDGVSTSNTGWQNISTFFTPTNFVIGRSGWADRDFRGLIDDVRIYDRVLTQDEITELAEGTEAE
jgi:hypothetical protein